VNETYLTISKWIENYTDLPDYQLIIAAISDNLLYISVDGSFFPEYSDLILAHFILTSSKDRLGVGDFISILAL